MQAISLPAIDCAIQVLYLTILTIAYFHNNFLMAKITDLLTNNIASHLKQDVIL